PCSILENFSCGHPDQVILASSCSIVLTRFLSLPDPPTVLCRLSISVLEVSLVSILKHPGHLLTPSFALPERIPFFFLKLHHPDAFLLRRFRSGNDKIA
ncbi:hypothetical protein ACKUE8_25690, partial [Escherichia coli]|uniref:hypothetical protein n=1 Tax=Escherichia coli TaxID=562 RepID=UPI00390C6888